MESRNYPFEKMLSEVDNGIYAIGALGGQTNMEMFTFSAEEAYMIRNGKIQEQVRDVVLTGNVFETLMNIDAIGNDLEIHGDWVGAVKADNRLCASATADRTSEYETLSLEEDSLDILELLLFAKKRALRIFM